MRGKVCFTNARKRKVYKIKAFDLKNTKFKVQKSNNFLQFLDTWDQFSNADFSFKKAHKPNKQKTTQSPPATKQTWNKTNTLHKCPFNALSYYLTVMDLFFPGLFTPTDK